MSTHAKLTTGSIRQQMARLAARMSRAVVQRGFSSHLLPNDVRLGPLVTGSDGATFGGHNDIGAYTLFGPDVAVGYGTTIGVNCVLLGPASIGNYCQLGPHVLVYGEDHPLRFFSTYTGKRLLDRRLAPHKGVTPVVIGHGVWIGCNAVVLRGSRVGNGAVIGAGSVVRGEVPPYSIAVGNPAKVIQPRIEPELGALVDQTEWWSLPIDDQEELSELADIDFAEEPERARAVLLELLERKRSRSAERGVSR